MGQPAFICSCKNPKPIKIKGRIIHCSECGYPICKICGHEIVKKKKSMLDKKGGIK